MTSLPDRRAWMTTAFVATFVAGAAVAVPLLTHLGGDKSDTIVAVDAPISSRATTTPTANPTTTTTVTGKPQVSVATATVTVTAPGGEVTVAKPGTTVTLPPTTTTVTAPARVVPPPTTLTATTTTTVTTKVTERGKPAGDGQKATGQGDGPSLPKKDPQGIQPQPSHPALLRNEGSQDCLDVKNGRAGRGTDGTPLQIWDCHDAGGRIWAFAADGTVRALNQCMDLAWGSIAENTAVQLVACNGSAAQQFRINNSRELVNPAARNMCVTVDGGKKGGHLFLRKCTGQGNQQWQRTATEADRKSGIRYG